MRAPLLIVPAALAALAFTGLGLRAAPRTGQQAATGPRDEDDAEDRAARRVLAERAVRENCLICHSDEMVRTQRLSPKQWKAEVDKMVGWGAPVPAEMRQAVTDYLTAEYPADAPAPKLDRAPLREFSVPGPLEAPSKPAGVDLARGATLYSRNCANCHGADGQGAELGPNLVEKPVLLADAAYAEVVRQGRGRMPGFAPLLDAGAEADILGWLRGRRYQPNLPASK
jgi:mono/diheme cytochrome c family protein